MKSIPPPCPEPEIGAKYWRSLEQLSDSPDFKQWVEREFPNGATQMADAHSRRDFVKIMSASFMLAGFGLTGCRRPEEKIYPFGRMPENYIHGVPQFYATAMPSRSSAQPLVVRSSDGRPTKIEGNSIHPDSNGGTDLFAQASILNLYDPDRAVRFWGKTGNNRVEVERAAAMEYLAQLSQQSRSNQGRGVALLLENSSSPTRQRLEKLIAEKLPQARIYHYEPIDLDLPSRAATLAFGSALKPSFQIDKADVILSLDADFLAGEEDAFVNIRRFSSRRKLENAQGKMSRLYQVESLFSVTGLNADHRLRVSPSQVLALAARLAREISGASDLPGLSTLNIANPAWEKWVLECAKDLKANPGASLVLAGHRQPLAVHLLAQAINAALGNIGKTVQLLKLPETSPALSLAQLAQSLNAGEVENLVIVGGNPVYNAPADLNWSQTQRKARNVVRLGYYEDETFAVSDWHLPLAHYLESWGDARSASGSLVPIQPLIEPLFDGLTEIELLARLAGVEKPLPHDLVRETFRGLPGGDAANAWEKYLHDGFLAKSEAASATATVNAAEIGKILSAEKPAASGKFEVVFARDYKMDDGRYNNNGWLQELPDPITKMTWENVILLSPKTAGELGVKVEDKNDMSLMVPVLKIELDGRSLEGPAWIQPGLADNTVALFLGYGRSKTGRIGKGSGYNAYALRASTSMYAGQGAKVSLTGRKHKLATTQNHWSMEGRPIVREANLDQYRKHPQFAKAMNMEEAPSQRSLYPNPLDQLKKVAHHQWGMTIDLNACVGCSACMIACQSENNIPIVGKDQVSRNREMHWIRIDRYYSKSPEDPQAVTQPMLCQHCEAAPCENVCPVNATVHDEEGLNVMVYNRCVGTRYCSNNCPYKVRRFNFFDYNRRPLDQLYRSPIVSKTDGEWELKRWWKDPERGSKPEDEWQLHKLLRNPDVTVRMRGVMEKCTFCVQRIETAKISQKIKAGASGEVEVPDGTFKTACQQACPAEAINFGNINDPASAVSKEKANDRNYSVLEFLATKPRLTYLARVRNPNPAMPDYHEWPLSLKEAFPDRQGDPFAGHHAPHTKNSTGPVGAKSKGGH